MNDNRNRNKRSGGGGGGGNNQRRRRGRSNNNNNAPRDNTPRGPVMTALGESTYEAVFDHGNEGYGVWFDGVVREDPMYRQHWKGNRPIFVRIEENQILITRELAKDEDAEEETEESVDIGNDVREDLEKAESTTDDGDDDAGDDSGDSPSVDSPAQITAEIDDETLAEGRIFTPEEAASLFLAENAAAEGNGDAEATAKPIKRTARAKKKPATEPADE